MIKGMTFKKLKDELEKLEYARMAGIEKIKKMEWIGGKYVSHGLNKGEVIFCITEGAKPVEYSLPIEYQLVEELEEFDEDSTNLYDFRFCTDDIVMVKENHIELSTKLCEDFIANIETMYATDNDDKTKIAHNLIRTYENSNKEDKTIIDNVFITTVGYSFETILVKIK